MVSLSTGINTARPLPQRFPGDSATSSRSDPATWLIAGATVAGVVHQWWVMDSPSTAIYVSGQVCIGWHKTGAYYTAKLTFSHNFPSKVWDAYY